MEHKFQRQNYKPNKNIKIICFNVILGCLIMGRIPKVVSYKNYTVGDSLGWFDKLAKPTIDYDKWASGKSFSLGDFLIFNTDNNHTVIQTNSSNTYKTCDNQGDNNVLWSIMDPNSTVVQPETVFVPLLKEGPMYFFSGDYDGEQCLHGQKLAINVTHGQGLPPSLRDDPSLASGPNSAPGPANADSGDDQSAPDTVVSTDFNHPKKVPAEDDSNSDDSEDGDTKKSNGASFLFNTKGFLVNLLGGILSFVWICC